MRRLLLLASIVLLSTAALAKPPGKDFSDPELVNMYIWLGCEAMEYSYEVMRMELDRLSKRYIRCLKLQDTGALGNPFFGLHCVFTEQTFDFRYAHIMSLRVAYDLMCNEEGRIEEEYEIQF